MQLISSDTTSQTIPTGNHYNVLGVKRTANLWEIRRAYFKLARQWHPDKCHHHDASSIFSMITDAYVVLSDRMKRAEYDRNEKQEIDPKELPWKFSHIDVSRAYIRLHRYWSIHIPLFAFRIYTITSLNKAVDKIVESDSPIIRERNTYIRQVSRFLWPARYKCYSGGLLGVLEDALFYSESYTLEHLKTRLISNMYITGDRNFYVDLCREVLAAMMYANRIRIQEHLEKENTTTRKNPSKPLERNPKTSGWTEETRFLFHPGAIISVIAKVVGFAPSGDTEVLELALHYIGRKRESAQMYIADDGSIYGYDGNYIPLILSISDEVRQQFPELADYADELKAAPNFKQHFSNDESRSALITQIEERFGDAINVQPSRNIEKTVESIEIARDEFHSELLGGRSNITNIEIPSQSVDSEQTTESSTPFPPAPMNRSPQNSAIIEKGESELINTLLPLAAEGDMQAQIELRERLTPIQKSYYSIFSDYLLLVFYILMTGSEEANSITMSELSMWLLAWAASRVLNLYETTADFLEQTKNSTATFFSSLAEPNEAEIEPDAVLEMDLDTSDEEELEEFSEDNSPVRRAFGSGSH